MTNREFFENYSTEGWALEQNLYFLIQTYIEQIEKKSGMSYLTEHYNPVTFVKEFMQEETIIDEEMAERSKLYTMEKNADIVIDVDETDNGWYSILDKRPENEQKCIVVCERIESNGCSYMATIKEATYTIYQGKGLFDCENEAYTVKYWREMEEYPYPNKVVKKEIESCRRNKVYPSMLDYQARVGYPYTED